MGVHNKSVMNTRNGAADRTRTGTVSLPADFKSALSTYSNTAAECSAGECPLHGIYFSITFSPRQAIAQKKCCLREKTEIQVKAIGRQKGK